MRSFLVTVDVSIPTGVSVVTPMTPFTKAPPAAIPVRFAPLIAGKAPVKLPAVKFVKFAPLIAGNVPVTCAAGRLVKFAPLPL